ncbi:hypothetical protein GEMRC1_011812 [Eukaryota sp. GEM-RC1]
MSLLLSHHPQNHTDEFVVLLPRSIKFCLACAHEIVNDESLSSGTLHTVLHLAADGLRHCTTDKLSLLSNFLFSLVKLVVASQSSEMLTFFFSLLGHPNIVTNDSDLTFLMSTIEDLQTSPSCDSQLVLVLQCLLQLPIQFDILYSERYIAYIRNITKGMMQRSNVNIWPVFNIVFLQNNQIRLSFILDQIYSSDFLKFQLSKPLNMNLLEFLSFENLPQEFFCSICDDCETSALIYDIVKSCFQEFLGEPHNKLELLKFSNVILNKMFNISLLEDKFQELIPIFYELFNTYNVSLSQSSNIDILHDLIQMFHTILHSATTDGSQLQSLLMPSCVVILCRSFVNVFAMEQTQHFRTELSLQLMNICVTHVLQSPCSQSCANQTLELLALSIHIHNLPTNMRGSYMDLLGQLVSCLEEIPSLLTDYISSVIDMCKSTLGINTTATVSLVGPLKDLGSSLVCLIFNLRSFDGFSIDFYSILISLIQLYPDHHDKLSLSIFHWFSLNWSAGCSLTFVSKMIADLRSVSQSEHFFTNVLVPMATLVWNIDEQTLCEVNCSPQLTVLTFVYSLTLAIYEFLIDIDEIETFFASFSNNSTFVTSIYTLLAAICIELQLAIPESNFLHLKDCNSLSLFCLPALPNCMTVVEDLSGSDLSFTNSVLDVVCEYFSCVRTTADNAKSITNTWTFVINDILPRVIRYWRFVSEMEAVKTLQLLDDVISSVENKEKLTKQDCFTECLTHFVSQSFARIMSSGNTDLIERFSSVFLKFSTYLNIPHLLAVFEISSPVFGSLINLTNPNTNLLIGWLIFQEKTYTSTITIARNCHQMFESLLLAIIPLVKSITIALSSNSSVSQTRWTELVGYLYVVLACSSGSRNLQSNMIDDVFESTVALLEQLTYSHSIPMLLVLALLQSFLKYDHLNISSNLIRRLSLIISDLLFCPLEIINAISFEIVNFLLQHYPSSTTFFIPILALSGYLLTSPDSLSLENSLRLALLSHRVFTKDFPQELVSSMYISINELLSSQTTVEYLTYHVLTLFHQNFKYFKSNESNHSEKMLKAVAGNSPNFQLVHYHNAFVPISPSMTTNK